MAPVALSNGHKDHLHLNYRFLSGLGKRGRMSAEGNRVKMHSNTLQNTLPKSMNLKVCKSGVQYSPWTQAGLSSVITLSMILNIAMATTHSM